MTVPTLNQDLSVGRSLWRLFRRPAGAAERRGRPRITHRPMRLFIEGRRYKTRDWSLGGFRIEAPLRAIPPRGTIAGAVEDSWSFAGGEFTAELCWSREGEAGFRFLDISSRTFLSMARHAGP